MEFGNSTSEVMLRYKRNRAIMPHIQENGQFGRFKIALGHTIPELPFAAAVNIIEGDIVAFNDEEVLIQAEHYYEYADGQRRKDAYIPWGNIYGIEKIPNL